MYFISNRITSIRNGEQASLRQIVWDTPSGSHYKSLYTTLEVLREAGVIRGFSFLSSVKNKNKVVIYLKYDSIGKSVIRSVFLVSTSARRIHISASSLWQPQSTSGFFVLSTIYGILTDVEARRYNVGGEVLFGVT